MTFNGSEGGGKVEEADHDENDWPGVAEVEVAAAHFLEQKKHADGYNDHRAHEAADGATLASASNTIAHLS